MAAILRGEGVTKRFDGLVAVDDVDFGIEAGEIVGLIGPNGSGKTTLFDCVTGVLDPDAGRVEFRGEEVTDRAEHRIAQDGLVRLFQEVRVYDGMTAYANVLASADHGAESAVDVFRRYPEAVHDRAESLLRQVDLWDKRAVPAGDLSYGQSKLLEFAMTLMPDPDVLLLDEPASGINPTTIRTVVDHIREVNERMEKTLFVIEHNMDVVMDISDRLYVMASGEVIAEGRPGEIQRSEEVQRAYLGGQ